MTLLCALAELEMIFPDLSELGRNRTQMREIIADLKVFLIIPNSSYIHTRYSTTSYSSESEKSKEEH